jgi:putative MATE family efflux protein
MHDTNPDEPGGEERHGWWATLRASLSGDEHDYTTGSLKRAILLLAIPMVLELAMESLFAICDIFWVAKLGSAATAAVGLSESVMTLYYAVAVGLSMAVTATVSRRIGQKDPEGAAKAGAQGIYVGLAVGLLTGLPCWLYAPEILGLMGASPEVTAVGTDYTRITLGANVVVLLLFMNNAIFRGSGDPALSMRALWLGNGINIVLDPFLIFGWGFFPEMGLTGAATATLIGRSVGLLYQFKMLAGGTCRVKMRGAAWHFDLPAMLTLLRVSFGGIAQMAIATTSWVALMRIMAKFGDDALAGYTIGIRILIFTLLPSWGLSNAAATLVGQNLGAKRPDRAQRSVLLTGMFNVAFLGLATILFLTCAPFLVGIFTSDAGVIAHGEKCLRIIGYGFVFYAWGMVMTQAFNGAGDTLTPTWMNLIAFWIVQVPLAWYLAIETGIGPAGVFWSVALADTLLTCIATPVFLRGKWKTREV